MNTTNVNISPYHFKSVSKFRRILPQVLAATGANILLIKIGICTSYATIVISALLNGKEHINMTGAEASWFGSMCYILEPIACILSGFIMNPCGRKKAMIFVNIPLVIAWTMIWQAHNLTFLFVANALLGFGVGLMQAPTVTYIGEICEPSVRGILVTYSEIFSTCGTFFVYLLGTILDWRTAAAICLVVPLATIIVVLVIPESPIWLLSKGRNEDAMKSLCWLRGWVQPEHVTKEFEDMCTYNANNFMCQDCKSHRGNLSYKIECTHKNETDWMRFTSDLKSMRRKETLRPLILSVTFFTFTLMTGYSAMTPNIVNVFKVYNMPLDAHWITVGSGVLAIAGSMFCTVLVNFCGKRPLVLVCMTGSCLLTFLLGLYAYNNIPNSVSSYAPINTIGETSTTPLVLFAFMIFFNYLGLVPIVWGIISEIFPYRTRGNASGLVAALASIINFIAIKTHISIENSFHIYGAFYFYAAFTLVGLLYLYLFLPETEQRKQEDIEADFATEKIKIFADDFIAKWVKSTMKCNKESVPEDNSHSKDTIKCLNFHVNR